MLNFPTLKLPTHILHSLVDKDEQYHLWELFQAFFKDRHKQLYAYEKWNHLIFIPDMNINILEKLKRERNPY